ncbi:unnamed protein product [Leuciscus chuanchicus]
MRSVILMFEAAQWAEISAVSFQISTDDQPTGNGSHVEGIERDMPVSVGLDEVMEPNMEYIVAQVTQKEVGRRFQVGPEIIDYILDRQKSHDLENDQTMLDRMMDSLATSWVNASNFKVALLGMDIVSALVTRLQERFKTQIGTVLPSLIDRLGDSKDQVRDQAQSLLLKIMDQAANPQYVWDRMLGGFRHKNNRTREAVCFCLISTLNVYGAHGLTLSKIVPHICHLLGDPTSQVRDGAMNCLVEIYRHVGERVRMDLGKKGLPQSRLNVIFSRFDEVQRSGNMILSTDKNIEDEDSADGGRSSSSSKGASSVRRTGSLRRPSSASSSKSSGKESSGAGAVDEEDFIRAFEDVPTVQIYSARELEDSMNKIREILSDDKHDWEQRVAALKKVRSLLLAGACDYDGFSQQLRLLEGSFKLSAKDLRSQVVREACITLGHLSSVLRNKFDHGAENIMPTLLNLVPNSARVMATSGMAAIRLIIRHTHYPRLIPIMTSNCTSKSVAVRRRCYEFLDLLLQEWQTHSLERNIAVLMETIKKGVHDADSEARSVARKCYWGFHAHFSKEAEHLFQALELTYQKALQSHLKSSDSIMSLPQSDRSSSSSQESLNRPLSAKTPVGSNLSRTKVVSSRASSSSGSLQRSRSDVDVNAAASAKSRMPTVPAGAPFSSATALPPGSYASLGRVRTRRQSSEKASGGGASVTDSRGRSRAKAVSQSQPGSRSSSPGKLLGHSYGRIPRATGTPSVKRCKIPRSQGCSRETSPSRGRDVRGSRIPRPSMSQGCSRDTSRESSRDTSPARGFSSLASHRHSRSTSALTAGDVLLTDRYGLIHQARISASVNAMRILNTGTEVEAAVADALLLGDSRNKQRPMRRRFESPGMYSDDDANSDASSACSERSFSSRNGAMPHYLRQTEDVAEILNHCASANWSERKEGLLGLQNLLKSQRVLSRVELKRLCEIFTRMFADPHSKTRYDKIPATNNVYVHTRREMRQNQSKPTANQKSMWVESANQNSMWVESANQNSVWAESANQNNVWVESDNQNSVWAESANQNSVWVESANQNSVWAESANQNSVWAESANQNSVWAESANQNSMWVESARAESANQNNVWVESDNQNSVWAESANQNSVWAESANQNSVWVESANQNSVWAESANQSSVWAESANQNSVWAESANQNSVWVESRGTRE